MKQDEIEDGMGFRGLLPTLAEKNKEAQFFRDACEAVERHCRALGGDVQVLFTKKGVEIAPLADAGSTMCRTLYDALKECEKWAEN